MTREQMIDEAVRNVEVPAFWREWESAFRHYHPAALGLSETCADCRSKAGMVREEFARIVREQPHVFTFSWPIASTFPDRLNAQA